MNNLQLRKALKSSVTLPIHISDNEKDVEEQHLKKSINRQEILIPEIYCVDDQDYNQLYPVGYNPPQQLIQMDPLAMEEDDNNYDMDSEDEEWLSKQNLHIPILKFEELMDKLEKSCSQNYALKNQKDLLKDDEEISTAVYEYWVSKRLKKQDLPLVPCVLTEANNRALGRSGKMSSYKNPYMAFRRRTTMQTRKSRKDDELSYMKMLRLQKDLSRALQLLELVKKRESAKKDYIHVSIHIFERWKANGFEGEIFKQVSSNTERDPMYSSSLHEDQPSACPLDQLKVVNVMAIAEPDSSIEKTVNSENDISSTAKEEEHRLLSQSNGTDREIMAIAEPDSSIEKTVNSENDISSTAKDEEHGLLSQSNGTDREIMAIAEPDSPIEKTVNSENDISSTAKDEEHGLLSQSNGTDREIMAIAEPDSPIEKTVNSENDISSTANDEEHGLLSQSNGTDREIMAIAEPDSPIEKTVNSENDISSTANDEEHGLLSQSNGTDREIMAIAEPDSPIEKTVNSENDISSTANDEEHGLLSQSNGTDREIMAIAEPDSPIEKTVNSENDISSTANDEEHGLLSQSNGTDREIMAIAEPDSPIEKTVNSENDISSTANDEEHGLLSQSSGTDREIMAIAEPDSPIEKTVNSENDISSTANDEEHGLLSQSNGTDREIMAIAEPDSPIEKTVNSENDISSTANDEEHGLLSQSNGTDREKSQEPIRSLGKRKCKVPQLSNGLLAKRRRKIMAIAEPDSSIEKTVNSENDISSTTKDEEHRLLSQSNGTDREIMAIAEPDSSIEKTVNSENDISSTAKEEEHRLPSQSNGTDSLPKRRLSSQSKKDPDRLPCQSKDSLCLEKNDNNSLATGSRISESEQIDNGLRVKRKRGRPRKHVVRNQNSSSESEDISSTAKEEEHRLPSQSNGTDSLPKRRLSSQSKKDPDRLPSQSKDSLCLEKNDNNSLATGSRIGESEQIDNGLRVKRKRGRPRKHVVRNQNSSSESEDISEMTETILKHYIEIRDRVNQPPRWLDSFTEEIRSLQFFQLSQFARMQEDLVDLERRKMRLVEKLATSLNKIDYLEDD